MDWNHLSDIATTVGVIVAGLALILGAVQIRNSAKISREGSALQAHRDYLKMCFEHPDFCSTNQFVKSHSEDELEHLLEERTNGQVKYAWFLSIMLNSIEQIIEYVSAEGGWRDLAIAQVRYHYGAMEIFWEEYGDHYGDTLGGIVEEALAAGPWLTPDDREKPDER